MTIPTLLFALFLAFLYGALYHFFRNGGFWRLILYLALSVFGFALGHIIGWWQGWVFIKMGSLNIGMSTLGSVIVLALGDWLSRFEPSRESKV